MRPTSNLARSRTTKKSLISPSKASKPALDINMANSVQRPVFSRGDFWERDAAVWQRDSARASGFPRARRVLFHFGRMIHCKTPKGRSRRHRLSLGGRTCEQGQAQNGEAQTEKPTFLPGSGCLCHCDAVWCSVLTPELHHWSWRWISRFEFCGRLLLRPPASQRLSND
jgi:hypothetical protein